MHGTEVDGHSESEMRLCEQKDAEKREIRSTEYSGGYRKGETKEGAPQGTGAARTGLDLETQQRGEEQQIGERLQQRESLQKTKGETFGNLVPGGSGSSQLRPRQSLHVGSGSGNSPPPLR
jgi:hypothetical protein